MFLVVLVVFSPPSESKHLQYPKIVLVGGKIKDSTANTAYKL